MNKRQRKKARKRYWERKAADTLAWAKSLTEEEMERIRAFSTLHGEALEAMRKP